MDIDHFLRLSFTYAIEAKELGDGPFGALILDETNEIIARAGNTTSSDHSITHHAEINAIQQAEYRRGKGKLKGCTLVSSAEPCPMCASAIVWSGLSRIIYGVSIQKLQSAGVGQIEISCRDILNRTERSISVEGPRLEEEGLEVFTQSF